MSTVTKFIVALCPATPIYLGCPDLLPIAYANTKDLPAYPEYGLVTTARGKARVFDTFEEAQRVGESFKGWGGAQRVEQIAVEVPEPPSLSTPAARIEARDAATSAWHDEHENLLAQEDSPREQDTLAAAATALSDLGYLVASQLYFDEGTRVCPTLTVTACDGSTITLEWDAMIDGFDYPTSGDDGCDLDEIEANTEDEPETASCDFCDGKFIEGEITVTGVPEGGIVYYCDACRAKDAATPRIDMVPSNVHLVEVDIDEDDIDRLGNYIGYGIESYDTVRQCDSGWWLIRIESVGRTTIAGILDDLDAVRHYHFRDRA